MVLLLFWRRAPAIATRPLHRSRTRLADSPSQAFKIHRALIRSVVEAHKARNPRVFGSVVRGDDSEFSDLDLLVDTTEGTDLFGLAAIELELELQMGISVHVTTSGTLRGQVRERVFAEAQAV